MEVQSKEASGQILGEKLPLRENFEPNGLKIWYDLHTIFRDNNDEYFDTFLEKKQRLVNQTVLVVQHS